MASLHDEAAILKRKLKILENTNYHAQRRLLNTVLELQRQNKDLKDDLLKTEEEKSCSEVKLAQLKKDLSQNAGSSDNTALCHADHETENAHILRICSHLKKKLIKSGSRCVKFEIRWRTA